MIDVQRRNRAFELEKTKEKAAAGYDRNANVQCSVQFAVYVYFL